MAVWKEHIGFVIGLVYILEVIFGSIYALVSVGDTMGGWRLEEE